MKKHVDENHVLIAKETKKEVNSPMRGSVKRQSTKKKRFNVFVNAISNSFGVKDPFKKDDLQ